MGLGTEQSNDLMAKDMAGRQGFPPPPEDNSKDQKK